MNTAQQPSIQEALRKGLMVPVFYHDDVEICESVLSVCFEEGIEMFEFTNRGANAKQNFERLQILVKSSYPGKYLGIGTVKTVEEAEFFVRLKPDFIVSPALNVEVGIICRQHDIPWMPGCMTPSEILQASINGASVVKIFPANVVGAAFVKAVKAVYPEIPLMPTGGIRPEKQSLQPWFDAGVLCVGMGSELLDKELIQNKDWSGLREKIKNARQVVQSCIP